MVRRDKMMLGFIAILLGLALMTLLWPGFGRTINREDLKLGLDLEGGAHLVYEAQFEEGTSDDDKSGLMSGIREVIESRVDAYGVSEPVIQKIGEDRLLVQLPGIENIEEAKKLIGQTVLVKFKEFKPFDPSSDTDIDELTGGEAPVYFALRPNEEGVTDLVEVPREEASWVAVPATATVDGEEKELTSQHFKGKVEIVWSSSNEPDISFEWDSEGSKISKEVTSRLRVPEGSPGTTENRLGIFVGGEYISAPFVQAVITEDGVITGMEISEAKRLRNLLNAGRLDVPLKTIEEHDVSATLGEDFVDWSIQAGVVGLLLVILFLIVCYRMPGVLAGVALLIYCCLVLAAFQIVEVVLTLAGIAGFILSIGMAVDANVLIFERMREEIRMGRTVRAAVEVGFNRAWSAIRDSNISTLLTCLILYVMGNYLGVPPVKGFALTLAIGVSISMFSAIVITKTFLRIVGTSGLMRRRSWFAPTGQPLTLSGEGR